MKGWNVAVFGAIAGAMAFLFFKPSPDSRTPNQQIAKQEETSPELPKSLESLPLARPDVYHPSGGRAPIAAGVWRELVSPMREDETTLALMPPDEVAAKFQASAKKARDGDAGAAMAIYQLASYCAARQRQGDRPADCDVLREKEVENPDYWLDLAISQGDPRAAIARFGNVRDALSVIGAKSLSLEERTQAVSALETATSSGKSEIFAMLASAYTDGLLVQQDPVKAYAYLEIYVASTSDPAGEARLRKLAGQLRVSDRARIQDIQRQVRTRLTTG